jgi:tetratricopeptide (TPR) repeat protein
MAPEQVLGRPADARTDLFTLGVLCYEMLTGERPFAGPDLATVTYRIVHEEPVPLATLRRDLPAALPRIIERCLAKDPAARPAGAAELLRDLRAMAAAPDQTATPAARDGTLTAAPAPDPPHPTDGRAPAGAGRPARLRAILAGLPEPRQAARRLFGGFAALLRSGWVGAGALPGGARAALFLLGASGLGVLVALLLFLTDPLQEAAQRIRQGRPQEAIALLTDLEAKQGARAETRTLLGRAYLEAGERRVALGAFRRAMELDGRIREDRDLLAGLVELLASREVGGEAADLLVTIGRPAVRPLRRVLTSEQYHLRWNAAKALERLGEPVDVVALYLLDLEREDCLTRRHAALRLGEGGDPRAVPPLLRAKERPFTENFCMFGALDEALARLTTR